ncbi:MAG: GtrA family protein [Phreatobacter sp.]|uniref:GtrA family protein n=1 Tax=Phreatobacter sp. TaxID=1966341 RepID=UPI001A3785EE|nr:GtrA family protein [Phreatobacter sp.]MBL8569779.1 GtrA family protein [Phreatobacter sp.]
MARLTLTGDGIAGKAVRFGVVGVLSGAIYVAVAGTLVHLDLCGPTMAGIIGYVAAIPVNFIGNRRFSFRSETNLASDLPRYVLLHIANSLLAAATMALTIDGLRLHYQVGLVATIVVIPVTSFIAMNLWVFGRRRGTADTAT